MRQKNKWFLLALHLSFLTFIWNCFGDDSGTSSAEGKKPAETGDVGTPSSNGAGFNLLTADAFENGVGKQNFYSSIDMKKEKGQAAALVSRVKAELVAEKAVKESGFNLVGAEGEAAAADLGEWTETDPINGLYFEKDGDKRKLVTKHLHSPLANYPAAIIKGENAFDACGDWQDVKKNWYFDDSSTGNNYVFLMGAVPSFNMGETDLSRAAFGNHPLGPFLEVTKKVNDEIVAYRSAVDAFYVAKRKYEKDKPVWDACMAAATADGETSARSCGAEPTPPVRPEKPTFPALPERGACEEKLFKYPYQFKALQSFDFPQKANHTTGKGKLVVKSGPTFTTSGEGKDFNGFEIAVREPLAGEDNALAIIPYPLVADGGKQTFNVVVETNTPDGSIKSTWADIASKFASDGTVAGRIVVTDAPATAASLITKTPMAGAWVQSGESFIDHTRMQANDFDDIVQCVQNQTYIRGLAGGGYNRLSAEQKTLMAKPYDPALWVDELGMEVQEDVTTTTYANGVPKVSFTEMSLMAVNPAPAVYDRYGNLVVPRGCMVDGVRYQEGDACYLFCDHSSAFSGSCYRNIVPDGESDAEGKLDKQLNSRRRAIMDSKKDDAGFLYMSMKGPVGQTFTVRVHHNLHKSHIFGSAAEVGGEDLKDGIFREKRTFTFPIPFCPKLDEKYEYTVCNVPKSVAHEFGVDDDGNPKRYPSCFKEQAAAGDHSTVQSWVVSNVRAMNEQIPKGSWQQKIDAIVAAEEAKAGAKITDIKAMTPWDEGYQLLKKTTFHLSSALLAQGLQGDAGHFVKNSKFTHACIPDKEVGGKTIKAPTAYRCKEGKIADENNLCSTKAFPRGTRMLRNGLIKFEYTTFGDITEEEDSLFLYLDTNPDPMHYFHKGFARNGDILEDTEANKIKPAAITDEKFKCFQKADGSLKEGIISKNYSPLVINVSHKPKVTLAGLSAGVEFAGRRFDAVKAKRKEAYEKKEIQHFRPEDAEPGTPTIAREVVTDALVKTGWIDGAKGDALLVMDLNENGKIDSGLELFGEATVMEKGGDWGIFGQTKKEDYAPNGFVALLQHDENDDFVIDANDSVWTKLRFWQDGKDGKPNGEVDDGELLTLESLNIVSFDLATIVKMHAMDKFGNRTLLRSAYSYKNTDGKVQKNMIFDVYFIFEEAGTVKTGPFAAFSDEEKTKLEAAKAKVKAAKDQKERLKAAQAAGWQTVEQ